MSQEIKLSQEELDQIKKWNYLRSTIAPKGRWLKILKSESDKVPEKIIETKMISSVQDTVFSSINKYSAKTKLNKLEQKQVVDTNELLANKILVESTSAKIRSRMSPSMWRMVPPQPTCS